MTTTPPPIPARSLNEVLNILLSPVDFTTLDSAACQSHLLLCLWPSGQQEEKRGLTVG